MPSLKIVILCSDDFSVSFDAKNLFPCIPVGLVIDIIGEKLAKNRDFKKSKFSIHDINELLCLCLSDSSFIYIGRHFTQKDSGPIGLSLMVKVSQIWMDYTLEEVCNKAEAASLPLPKILKVYVDDIYALLTSSSLYSKEFLIESYIELLNSVHPKVQYTCEPEQNRCLPYLDM